MEPDRWKQVETIVAAVLDLEIAERECFVSNACGDDHELRAEVEELLAGKDAAVEFLETRGRPKQDRTDDLGPIPADPLIGSVIGTYRLEEHIGSGGMGVVYLVSRADEEYLQRAALKLLHPGMASHTLLQRFRTERQILAVLEHPNIARLLDGGTTPAGLPYLVMEYIEGVPLDRYCDEHFLDCRERIELMLQVCNGVAFAHRSLIVHRDLKPGNILVTDNGTPKLLDFGIAKLLDPSTVSAGEDLTRTGLRPMSPAFASPEQIRGRPITTGSDVYSLGVVLHKLLTGELPRRFDDLTPAAMERRLSRSPMAPSARVGEDKLDAPVAGRVLRGDLDAILLKALREEPEQRYATVDEFVEDLERHLAALPVRARQGTLGYRAGRFLRRHTAAVLISVLVGAMALGAAVSLLEQNRRVSYQRDRAEAMAEFSSGLLEMNHLVWTIDNATPIKSLLWQNLNDAKRRLSTDPNLRGDQLMLLARGFSILGWASESEELATTSYDLRRSVLTSEQPVERRLMNDLAASLSRSGRSDDAASVLEEALEYSHLESENDALEIARSHTLLGLLHWGRYNQQETRKHFETAISITAQSEPKDEILIAELKAALAVLEVSHDLESPVALPLLQEALMGFRSSERTSLLAWPTIRTLAKIQRSSGALRQAIDTLSAARSDARISWYVSLEDLVLSLGVLHHLRGEYRMAAEFLQSDLSYSPDMSWQLQMLIASAHLQAGMGNLANTETECQLLLDRLQRNKRAIGVSPGIFRARAIQQLAWIDLKKGRRSSALNRTAESIRILQDEELTPAEVIDSSVQGAQIIYSLGDVERSETFLREMIAGWNDLGDPWNPDYVRSLTLLAEIVARFRTVAEARVILDQSREIVNRQETIDPSPRINEQLAEIHRIQGELLRRTGDLESARGQWREALRLLALNPEGTIGADHHLIAGKTWLRLGDETEASRHAQILYDLGWRWPEWILMAER